MAPAELSVTPEGSGLKVVLQPAAELLDPDSIEVQVRLVSPSGEERPLMLLPAATGWEGRIDPAGLSGEWQLAVHLGARTRAGNPVSLDLDPVTVQGTAVAPSPAEANGPVAADPLPEVIPEQAPESDTDDWILPAALFGGINLLLVLIGGGLYWFLRRRRERVQLLDEEEQTGNTPAGDAADAGRDDGEVLEDAA